MAASTVKKGSARPVRKPVAKKPAPQQNTAPEAKTAPKAKPVAAKKKRVKKEKDPNRIGFFYGKGSIDVPMLVITVALLVLGITMMFSASHALSYRDNGGDSYKYANRQLMFAVAGLVLMQMV